MEDVGVDELDDVIARAFHGASTTTSTTTTTGCEATAMLDAFKVRAFVAAG